MEMTAGLLEKYGYLDTDATDYVLINVSSVSDRKNAKSLGISSGEYQEIQRIKENETADSKPKISADDIDKYGGLGVRELLENSGQLEKKEESAQPVGETQPTQSNGGEKHRKNLKTRMELVKTIIKMRLLPNAEKIVLRNQNRVLMEKKLVVIIPMAAKMNTTLPRIIRLIIQI